MVGVGFCKGNWNRFQTPPGDKALYETEGAMAGKIGREFLLAQALKGARTHYDYILLDCPPIQGLKRARGRNRRTLTCQDRFERESLLFHRRVRQGYLKLMRQNKKRFIKINALLPIQKTHQQILKKVEGYLS